MNLPDSIDIDGVARPTRNNLDQPIHPTLEGIENFWRWFGDSRTVDGFGRPMVLYHGTADNFTKINLNKGAQGLFWLTSNRVSIERKEAGAQGHGKIMALYAKIEHPADWSAYENLMLMEFKGRGLDGAMLSSGNGHFDAFIMDPRQVKSAFGNSGRFDPNNPNINDPGAPAARKRCQP